MTSLFINVGHNNFVNANEVVAIVEPNSAPITRLRNEAKEKGTLVDASQGKKTRSLLVLSSGHLVLSSVEVTTLTERFNTAFGFQKDPRI